MAVRVPIMARLMTNSNRVKPPGENRWLLARKGAIFFKVCVKRKHTDTEFNSFWPIARGQRQRSSQLSSTRSQSFLHSPPRRPINPRFQSIRCKKEKNSKNIPSCSTPVYPTRGRQASGSTPSPLPARRASRPEGRGLRPLRAVCSTSRKPES
jgi:hypothetical protein